MKIYILFFILTIYLFPLFGQNKTKEPIPTLINETTSNYFKTIKVVRNKKFIIDQHFNINSDIHFVSCRFYMKQHSDIQLQFNCSTHFDSCIIVAFDTFMWKGITLLSGAIFDADYTLINDADTAIICKENAVYHINNSQLNRNLVAISVHPNTNSFNTSTLLHSHIYCQKDTFNYYRSPIVPTVGTLFYPHQGERTHFGIYVRDNLQLTIGDTIDGVKTRNLFEDMYDGIYSYNSALQVRNNDFKKMQRLYKSYPIPSRYYYGNAIEHIYGAEQVPITPGIHIAYCNMDSIINACVYLEGKLIFDTIEYNHMNGYYGILAKGMGFNGTQINYTSTIINNNTIQYSGHPRSLKENLASNVQYNGIWLNNSNKVNVAIIKNNISTRGYFASVSDKGIYISQANASSSISPSFKIIENNIVGGVSGIQIDRSILPVDINTSLAPEGANRITKRENNLIYNNSIYTRDTKIAYSGIALINSSEINVYANKIIGSPGDEKNTSCRKRGIFLNSAKDNRISCNTMDTVFYGLVYQGDCSMENRLFANNFNVSSYHLYGVNAASKIGNQFVVDDGTQNSLSLFSANKMNNKALQKSISNVSEIFNWGIVFTGKFNPSSPYATTLIPSGVLLTITDKMLYNCADLKVDNDSNGLYYDASYTHQLLEKMRKVDTIRAEENLGAKIMSEEYYTEKLMTTPQLLEKNKELMAYYENKKATPIRKMIDIKRAIAVSNFELANDKLAQLETTNSQQEADKIVFGILNEYEKRACVFLKDEEYNKLMEYANYCPISYGAAVYAARALINQQKGLEYYTWNDEAICRDGVSYRRNDDEIELDDLVENKNIVLYPNTANQNVSFEIKDLDISKSTSIKAYYLKDITGKIVKKELFENPVTSGIITTSTYPAGLYFLYFKCSDDTFVLIKFVIKH